ncbi:MAG: phosphoglucomutase/phosphomannomutase family protein [Actinomycetota bacterium]
MIKFGTDGWRDVVADGFTITNLRLVTRGISAYIKTSAVEPRLVVGYDCRFMGREFAAAVADEMSVNGVSVILGNEAYPTPTVAYSAKALGADGAIMLTASHNPYYYNGLKFIPEYAGPATEEITTAIEEAITSVEGRANLEASGRQATASIENKDLSTDYMKALVDYLDIDTIAGSGLKTAIDPYHGSGRRLMPELARTAGLDATVIRDNEDPLFGDTMPDPSEKNLGELRELVVGKKLDVGLALDGDADRFGIIADDGSYLTPNQVVALLLGHMVRNRGAAGIVVRTVATTHLLDAMSAKMGLKIVETPVGFKHVGLLMREEKVIIGGEESGGLSVLGHIPEKDGLLADMLVVEMIAKESKPLSTIWKDLVDEFGHYYNERLDIPYPSDKIKILFDSLKDKTPDKIGGLKVERIETIDGVKLILAGNAWLLIRPSGTEPLVRAYIETKSAGDMQALKTAARELLSA